MHFNHVIGQQHLKAHLSKTLENGRIPHAQLFVGQAGCGLLPMAIGYAQALLCSSHSKETEAFKNCASKVERLVHPDLHFVYPVNRIKDSQKNPVSSMFIEEWRTFATTNPYGTLFEWFQSLGIEKKQGNINVHEAKDMMKNMSLKPYEGGFKVMIVWMADAMNTECANKILKLIEEPPNKTVLLLLTEREEHILGTIRSRCQKLQFPSLSEEDIAAALMANKELELSKAKQISRNAAGDYNRALQLLASDGDELVFEKWFIDWVRGAFAAKGNKKAINMLLVWSESLAGEGRETQKKFLAYCVEVFRQALLKSYKADSLLFFETQDDKFSMEKFAPFVHQNNIFDITESLEDASYHIERNGNAKIIFTDLSIKLTRLIHRKQ